MARGYRLSVAARADLDEIWLYLANRSSAAADAVISACFREFWELCEHPGLGRRRSDIPEDCRCKVVGMFQSYLIVYRLVDDRVQVLRVLHGARFFGALFQDEPEPASE